MKRHGLSLVEMIISVTILGFVSFIVVTMYFTAERVRKSESAGSYVQMQNIFGQNRIRTALKDATAILSNVTLSGVTYTTGQQTVVFTVPSIDVNGDIIANTWDTFVLTLTGTPPTAQVKIIVAPAAASTRPARENVITSAVDYLQFRYNAATLTSSSYIDTTLRTVETVGGTTRRFTTDTRITLRNA